MIIDFQRNTTKYDKHEGVDINKTAIKLLHCPRAKNGKNTKCLFFVTLRPTYDFFGFKTRKWAERDKDS